MDSYTVGTVVIFCSITWIIASPLVIFHYRKLYLTASRELEELSQKKTVTADIKPATNDISEKMQLTKKPTAEDTPKATPLSDHELLTKIRSMSPYDFEK